MTGILFQKGLQKKLCMKTGVSWPGRKDSFPTYDHLEVVKSRGMSHSGQPIPLVISSQGIHLEGGNHD